jgi:LysM repeat protein
MKIFATVFFLLYLIGYGVDAGLQAQHKHKVKSGETLSQLARKYKVSVEELIRLNPEAAKGLKAGGEINLPGNDTEKAAESKEVTGRKHKVISGESLSRIAKKYHVSVSELESWNRIKAVDLKAGQEILVSGPDAAVTAEIPEEKPTKLTQSLSETHSRKVEKGETLSSIAQKEGTTIAEIKKLNQLKKDQLRLGQVLLIPGAAPITSTQESAPAAPKPVSAKSTDLPAKNDPSAKADPVKTEPKTIEPAQPVEVNEIPVKQEQKPMNGIREINNTLGYTRVVETGFAEAIEGDVNSKKHLCLHKTAPTGAILQVKNEVNGQSVFVKVIGKLPETGSNEKIIIRISRQAYERLMASGKRFPVEVSYPESQP